MKITKDYLRQLIRENLEVGQDEAEIDDGVARLTPEMALSRIEQELTSDKRPELKLDRIRFYIESYKNK